MSNVDKTDVLVVGAGPIGLIAANLMADQGLNVILAEKNHTTSDLPRAISATDETLRIMEEIGILDKLAPEMLLNTGARYFGRNDQLLAEVHPARMVLGQPGKSQFDQPVMEALLLEAAEKRNKIDLRFDTEVFGVRETGSGVEADLIDGTGKTTVNAKWIVAADGGRSPMRAQLGITLEGSTQTQKWIVLDIVDSEIKSEAFSEFHCNGSRPVVVVPGVNGRRRYEFMLLPSDSEEVVTTDDFIIDLVSPFEKISASNIRRAAVYVAHQRIAATFRRGHTILIGDAAHLMPPFAGQALNAGARDAANVAWKISEIVQHGAPESLIDTYEEERRPHAADMVRLSHLIGKVVMATNRYLVLARDVAVNASGLIPPLKKWITGMRFLKQPHYTSGCVVPSSDKTLQKFVGSAVPQPSLTTADGEKTPMDRLLGNGWSLVRIQGAGNIEIASLQEPGKKVSAIDSDGQFAEIPHNTTLIIRPDRYVAAAVPRSQETVALNELAKQVPSLNSRNQSLAF
ncbi:FAD-dependent monooxygenase [Corynebacterium sp. S7]